MAIPVLLSYWLVSIAASFVAMAELINMRRTRTEIQTEIQTDKLITARFWLSVFLDFVFFGCAFDAAHAEKPQTKPHSPGKIEVVLFEHHGSVVGSQLVYVAPNAVRFDCLRKGIVIVCKAPDWQVLTYSLQSKKYFETPLSQYSTPFRSALLVYGIDLSSYQLKKVGVDHVYGHDCIVYKPVPKADPTGKDPVVERITGIWVASDMKAASQIGDLSEKEMCLPLLHKVLIKFDYIEDKFNTHALSTTYCHDRMESSSLFERPAGLQNAKNLQDVYPGDSFKQFLP